jgi:tetratricopeptide (TPR) repeat protein
MNVKSVFIALVCFFLLPLGVRGAIPFFSREKSIQEIQREIDGLPKVGKEKTKARLYTDLGDVFYKNGQMMDAAQSYEEALKYRSRDNLKKHIYRYLGKCYESAAHYDKAISAYEKAVEFDRKNWRLHRDLARIYEMVKLNQKSLESYEKAIHLAPKKPYNYFFAARIYRDEGLLKKAEDYFVKSLELGYKPESVFAELSLVFERAGRFGEAADALNETLFEGSKIKQWGRLIYLATLSDNEELMKKGMDQLYEKNASEDTIRFYEDIIRLGKMNPSELVEMKLQSESLQSAMDWVF